MDVKIRFGRAATLLAGRAVAYAPPGPADGLSDQHGLTCPGHADAILNYVALDIVVTGVQRP